MDAAAWSLQAQLHSTRVAGQLAGVTATAGAGAPQPATEVHLCEHQLLIRSSTPSSSLTSSNETKAMAMEGTTLM